MLPYYQLPEQADSRLQQAQFHFLTRSSEFDTYWDQDMNWDRVSPLTPGLKTNKQTKNNPHLKWTYSQNFTYSVFMHESWSLIAIILLAKVKPEKLCFYLFLSLQGVMSHPWCRRQQQYHGWALLKWCLLHLAVPAWCCMLTSSRLHPALMSAGLPTDVTSEIPGEKYLRNMLSFVTLWYTTIHHPVSTNISC